MDFNLINFHSDKEINQVGYINFSINLSKLVNYCLRIAQSFLDGGVVIPIYVCMYLNVEKKFKSIGFSL